MFMMYDKVSQRDERGGTSCKMSHRFDDGTVKALSEKKYLRFRRVVLIRTKSQSVVIVEHGETMTV